MRDLKRSSIDRRTVLKGITAASATTLLACLGGCETLLEAIRNRPVRRRLRTGSPEADAAISSYTDAVRLMKQLPASDPTSWVAQAAIHGTVSGGFNFCQHNTPHFFSWHRAYLLFFERICRKLSGDTEFGLPYWNWNQNNDIHPAFLDATSPLFNTRNNTSIAGFSAFSDANLDTIFSDANFFTFSDQLEGSPHNIAHGVVGSTMGTGGSPLDPIFWPHHCMVDYCWAKWNIELGNDNTNDPSWNNTSWSHFVNEEGVSVTVDALTTVLMPLLSYRYETSTIGSTLSASMARTKREHDKLEKRLKAGAEVVLDIRERYRVADAYEFQPNTVSRFVSRLAPKDVRRLIESDREKERVFLSIDYSRMPDVNDFIVRAFINAPNADQRTPTSDPHFAGSIGFFGTAADHAQGHDHSAKTDFLINVSETLERLASRQMIDASQPITLQLVPIPLNRDGAIATQTLSLDRIELLVSPLTIQSKNR